MKGFLYNEPTQIVILLFFENLLKEFPEIGSYLSLQIIDKEWKRIVKEIFVTNQFAPPPFIMAGRFKV